MYKSIKYGHRHICYINCHKSKGRCKECDSLPRVNWKKSSKKNKQFSNEKENAKESNPKSAQKFAEITSIAGSDSPESNTVNEVTANHEQSSKRVIIVGDSILNGINEKGLSRNDDIVKVRPYPGATSEDLIDHIKLVTRRKPDIVVLHIGTNDSTNGITTQVKLQEVVDIL